MAAEDGEGARGEGSAEAVGDSVTGVQRLQGAAGKGAVGVMRALGRAAKDVDSRADALGAEAGAAKQSAAADGCENGVQVAHILEELLGGGRLSRGGAVVVVGRDQ